MFTLRRCIRPHGSLKLIVRRPHGMKLHEIGMNRSIAQIRSFSDKSEESSSMNKSAIADSDKPNYILRVFFVSMTLGGIAAYIWGLPKELQQAIDIKLPQFDIFSDNNQSKGLSTLPKPPKEKTTVESPRQQQIAKTQAKQQQPQSQAQAKSQAKSQPKSQPKSQAKPQAKSQAKSQAEPKPKPPSLPSPPVSRTPQPKPQSQPQPQAQSQPQLQSQTAVTNAETTNEYQTRLDRLRMEYLQLENTKKEQSKPFVKDPAPIQHSKSQTNEPTELIKELKQKLRLAERRIGEMEGALIERDSFLAENINKLEEGNRAYEEIVKIYEEMRQEYQESMMNEMEFQENDRRKRWKDLEKQSIDIRVFEVLLSWFDKNSEFFASLAEYNNIIDSLETKFNNGISFDKELSRLLQYIPNTFLSKQLLNDLEYDIHNNKTNLIYSHSQLYDRFCVLEKSLRETSMTPRNTDSLWANLWAKIFSSVLMREQIARDGSDAQARISRAGYAMKSGDLRSALTELNYLDEVTLYPAQDWLRCARERLLGLYAIEMLKAELLSRSLNIGYTVDTNNLENSERTFFH